MKATLVARVSAKLDDSPVVSAAVEQDARRLLELLAARRGRSLSAEVRAAVQEHLGRAILAGTLEASLLHSQPDS